MRKLGIKASDQGRWNLVVLRLHNTSVRGARIRSWWVYEGLNASGGLRTSVVDPKVLTYLRTDSPQPPF